MEINAEISKIFGEQMAELFSQKITDEELEETARECFENLKARGFSSGSSSPSYLERKVSEKLEARLDEAVKDVIRNIPNSVFEIAARDVVNQAQEIVKAEYVKELAKAMKSPGLSDEAIRSSAGCIASAIASLNYRR